MQQTSRAWALKAQWPVLGLATAAALYLAYSHIVLTHGAGGFESLCNVGGKLNCDAVNTSAWASLGGAPISAWALPVYGAMAFLAWRALRDDDGGHKAQGTLVLLGGFNVAVSAFLAYISLMDIGFLCLFCMSLYALHTVSFVLALLPPHRMPALPAGPDLGRAAGITAALTAVSIGGSLAWASQLDAQVIASLSAPVDVPEGQDVGMELRSGGRTALRGDLKQVEVGPYSATYGNPDAAVQVIEFADFECGYCRQLSFNLAEIKERYKDRVQFVFRHFPMDQECNANMSRTHHPHACEAAMAAKCADAQGKFWEYHDLLFANQKRLDDTDLAFYAEQLELDMGAWRACTTDSDKRRELLADIDAAAALEISGTPRIYIGGREMRGAVSAPILDAAIRVALGDATVDAAGQVDIQRSVVTDEAPPSGPIAMVPATVGDRTFFIDAVEASVDEQGAARAEAGATPTAASWASADAACRAAGKRMCSQEEWLAACQGADPIDQDGDGSVFGDFVEGRLFPYGRYHREGLCWDGGDADNGGPRGTGTLPGCRTPSGVYDQAGNLQEWVGSTSEKALLAGGAWYYGDKANCGASYDNFGTGYSNRATGFRCCADTQVSADTFVAAAADATPDEVAVHIGERIPPFSGQTPEGDTFGSVNIAGKVTLINFWASWCTPCQREMPALKAVQAEFEAQGFTVVAINVDREPQRAMPLLRRVNPNYPVIYDPESAIMGSFDVMAMPTSLLIDREGKVLMQHAGYSDEWLEELKTTIRGAL